MNSDDLLDVLMDLKHDLAKYIRLPFAMLRRDASNEEVKKSLETALLHTRKKEDNSVTAREIWQSFLTEAESSLRGFETYDRLKSAVEKALSWERILDRKAGELDRNLIEADFSEVDRSIRELIGEVRSDR